MASPAGGPSGSVPGGRYSGAWAKMETMARHVTLVLCGADGEPLGTAAPFVVEWPWWQDAEAVVTAAAENGLDVIVLRLLGGRPAVEGGPLSGGEVTYLAELRGPVPS